MTRVTKTNNETRKGKKMTTYRLNDAIALVQKHGFEPCVRSERIDANPLVNILQDWWPKGEEVAKFRLARGKYRGNDAGFAVRRATR